MREEGTSHVLNALLQINLFKQPYKVFSNQQWDMFALCLKCHVPLLTQLTLQFILGDSGLTFVLSESFLRSLLGCGSGNFPVPLLCLVLTYMYPGFRGRIRYILFYNCLPHWTVSFLKPKVISSPLVYSAPSTQSMFNIYFN